MAWSAIKVSSESGGLSCCFDCAAANLDAAAAFNHELPSEPDEVILVPFGANGSQVYVDGVRIAAKSATQITPATAGATFTGACTFRIYARVKHSIGR